MAKSNGNGNGNGNRGRRPTDDERAWLWARWQELQSETQLAKEHHPTTGRRFARSTIHKVRDEDDWDGRTSDIRQRAHELADEQSAEDLAHLQAAARALANAQLKALLDDKGKLTTGTKASVGEFVQVAKLLRDMGGDPTQRIEIHVMAATEQLAQTITEVINSTVKDTAEREAILAGILGALGRVRVQSRAN